MNYSSKELILFFIIVSFATILTRVLPFLLFPEHRSIPKYITYLADILPYTIMGMLVIYCLKNISLLQSPFALPEFLSIVVITFLHLWKKNTLLSIGGGALFYMLLLQCVFVHY